MQAAAQAGAAGGGAGWGEFYGQPAAQQPPTGQQQ
jgi:hypothetical protein